VFAALATLRLAAALLSLAPMPAPPAVGDDRPLDTIICPLRREADPMAALIAVLA
jgi:hypothetical protein